MFQSFFEEHCLNPFNDFLPRLWTNCRRFCPQLRLSGPGGAPPAHGLSITNTVYLVPGQLGPKADARLCRRVIKPAAELSADHHLVVSGIRWVSMVNREHRAEATVREVVNSHLQVSFPLILGEVGDMFWTSVADAASKKSCGLTVVGACHGGNWRTWW